MDNVTLKKKLSAYLSDKGYLKNVSNEVLYEVLLAWENWPGSSRDFYRSIGFSFRQMATLIGKAKKLKREGYFGDGDFKSVTVEGAAEGESTQASSGPCAAAEIIWNNGQVIRFSDVTILIDFLRKSA